MPPESADMIRKFLVVGVSLAIAGCGQPKQISTVNAELPVASGASSEKSRFPPFFVYQDRAAKENHFIPSGFMPNGKCLKLEDAWKENCRSGETCIRVTYDIQCSQQDQRWSGIYWLNPADNWGARKGGFDLNGASKLTFWARGDKGGERIEEFKVGGIVSDYPDSDVAMIGPVILSREWREYTIDLRGKDLSYISGGFSWAANTDANPQECVFYLDEIKYQ